jgi:hypothetical protein
MMESVYQRHDEAASYHDEEKGVVFGDVPMSKKMKRVDKETQKKRQ